MRTHNAVLVLALAAAALSGSADDECYAGYPRHYVAPRVDKAGSAPVIDGVVDGDPAWEAAPWTDKFVDITGDASRPPYYDTRAKMRWDDRCLYVGAVLQEPQAWANLTLRNSIIFRDNDFEIFVDPDGSTHRYKELEFNARAVHWNLMLVRPYLNGGPAVCNATSDGQCSLSAPDFGVPYWDAGASIVAASHVEGSLNDPLVGSKWWSIEACIPIAEYVRYENVSTSPPREGDRWRINFSRVQWHIHVEKHEDGTLYYAKDEGRSEENWLWQPIGVVNVHVPERWGYVQFGSASGSQLKRDPQWPVRRALAAIYEAEVSFRALYGTGFTANVDALVANAKLDSSVAIGGKCTGKPSISLTAEGGFVAKVASADGSIVGSIRDDRWFSFQ